MKARTAAEAKRFTDIPNIGPQMKKDFERLGLVNPEDIKGKDAYVLYIKMCKISGVRQDPCVLDTYMAAIDFMNGAEAKPWWRYTVLGKKEYPNL